MTHPTYTQQSLSRYTLPVEIFRDLSAARCQYILSISGADNSVSSKILVAKINLPEEF
ncbi:hypothetical protein PQG02_35855 (plasmid) [Nostoc sp. UHCC 0926]|uniref:hypothetical protein n=1 Tax=Nostoc sp. UHCC 0926 TaxID=3025190 RepID=UPI002361170E|nr:hypothetical protein [Nostoc sp. UHCC 0926]WDD36519.1 hypothetical protein PQG02_35855 [Nostoc sp. UHCC 0926]